MSAKKKQEVELKSANMQLIGIVNRGIYLDPEVVIDDKTMVSFEINVGHKFRLPESRMVAEVNVVVVDDQLKKTLCTLKTAVEFFIENLDEIVVKHEKTDAIGLPLGLLNFINGTSISTVRGILFMAFRGSVIENLVLPMVDLQLGVHGSPADRD